MVIAYLSIFILDFVVIFWIIHQLKLDHRYKKEKELEEKVKEILKRNKLI